MEEMLTGTLWKKARWWTLLKIASTPDPTTVPDWCTNRLLV
jgi:hypothetical protein